MTRKAGIGVGEKSDFTKDTEGFPPPNKYNLSNFVQKNKTHKKGYLFGLSRAEVKVNSWQIASSGFPGVGRYDHKSQLKISPSYFIAKKYKNPCTHPLP